ncbi:MAG TPA: S8 family serine peptidase, partial [Xanthomonadaceae bacterium]|nr:S8 family serine peptidase [Xanthomonadaceae bacterium]
MGVLTAMAMTMVVAGSLNLPPPAMAASGHDAHAITASQAALVEAPYYVVVLNEAPLASYRGEVAGLAAPGRIAHLGGRLDVRSPASLAYVNYLRDRQESFLQSVTQRTGRTPELLDSFQHALNAVVLVADLATAQAIADMPEVAFVDPGRDLELLTDAGPTWIGAPAIWDGSGTGPLPGTQGEGVVVGIIDSGINFEHPSFATMDADGYTHSNPFGSGNYIGLCAAGEIDEGRCTDKLIGAYDFVYDVCVATNCSGGAWDDSPSADDNSGHGTHVASTAAGNAVDAGILGGAADVRISGVAPRANIVAYDVCYVRTTDGLGLCPLVSSAAAANQAVADGVVDVLSFSIGGGTSPWTDSVSQAFLGAVDAGLVVSTSAGNSGPGAGTTGHRGPWTITVGASTHNRDFFANPLSIISPDPTPDVQDRNSRQGTGPFLAASMLDVPIDANPT